MICLIRNIRYKLISFLAGKDTIVLNCILFQNNIISQKPGLYQGCIFDSDFLVDGVSVKEITGIADGSKETHS